MSSHLLAQWSPENALGFGAAALSGEGGGYGFGQTDAKEMSRVIELAISHGIRVFDTAPIYGYGQSEIALGKLLSAYDNVYVVSKCGVDWHENNRVNMTNDPKVAEKMLGQSLKRLNRDVIDLYMIHWPDPKIDIRRPLEILARAKDAGKIRAIGLCNTSVIDMELAREVTIIEAIQSQINFFHPLPQDVLLYAQKNKLSIMGWGTFDKGIIAGSVTPDRSFEKSDARSWAPWWKNSDKDAKMQSMQKIFPRLIQYGHNGLELGLTASLKEAHMPLIGAKSVAQLKDVLKAKDHLLNDEFYLTLK